MEYLFHIAILVTLYTMLSQSLTISAGFAGLLSLAQAGFYGIGAYTTAILSIHYHLPFWVNLPIAIIVSSITALTSATIALRTIDDYFIICTLGIQVIIYSLMDNCLALTGGPFGMASIPPIYFFGFELGSKAAFLTVSLFFMLLIWLITRNIKRSGFGLALHAIKEDEILSMALGINVYKHKAIAFMLSAAFASIPGALYAHYISFIDPSSFTVGESIFILSIVITGGPGRITGSFLSSVLMICIPELLRIAGLSIASSANVRQIIYGLVLIAVLYPKNERKLKAS